MRRFCGALLPLLIFCNFKWVHLKKLSHSDCLPGLSENEFVFEGNGYLALENRGFESRNFSQIKFSFKTSVDEGLVYFTVTPDRHFESLELRNGKVIYQFLLDSGQVEMATEKRCDDGKWHDLEIRWIQEESSLVIDDSVESVARYPEHFKNLNFKNAVYFGGLKERHNIKDITAKGFNGSIKDVQLGGISRRISMHTEMRNARSGCPRRQRREVDEDYGPRTGYACEGSTMKIECAPGLLIRILKAEFGRFLMAICNDGRQSDGWNLECMSSRSLRIVSEMCDNREETCFIQVTTRRFGDPCPMTPKYLEVQYRCEAVPRVPPHFVILPQNVEVMPGGSVNLSCEAMGVPMPYVKWRIGALELNPEDEAPIGKSFLTLSDVQETATYTCIAASELGSIEADAEVRVKVLPKPPTGLVASKVTATSVKLAWNMVTEDPVESYILQYKQKHPLRTKYDEVSNITGTDYTIHGLSAYTVYEFRVLAVNNIGRGTPSNPLNVSTGEMR